MDPRTMFASILEERTCPEVETQFPFVPLTAPFMPLPGPDFTTLAARLGDQELVVTGKGPDRRIETVGKHLHYLYRLALYDSHFTLPVQLKGSVATANFVPGHTYAGSTRDFCGGPRPARVMVVGKHPGQEEVQQSRNFVGPSSQELYRALEDLGCGVGDIDDWYLTNLVKHQSLNPNSQGLPVGWIKNCAPLLQEELRLIQPEFLLCLGSDASKHLLGTPHTVSAMVGRVVELKVPLHLPHEEPTFHTVKVMAALHPAAVFRTPELYDEFFNQISLFWQLINGAEIGGVERDIDHGVIYTERALSRLVDEMLADPRPDANVIAVDGEWHGDHPSEPGAYLRTVQFSHKERWARSVILRHQGGAPAFKPSIERAFFHLRRLLKYTPPDAQPDANGMATGGEFRGYRVRSYDRPARVGGHFLRADIPWLLHNDLDLRPEYDPSPDPYCRDQGGWDTSLLYHSANETARYKLEEMATRLTTVPRYDTALQKWKKDYCRTHGLDAEELEGYGECPDYILHPYGNYDPDATRRCYLRLYGTNGFDGLVGRDRFGNDCWIPYWIMHRASLCCLEMEMTGFAVDKDRADEIAIAFVTVQDRLLAELRAELNWPTFNPGGFQQCVSLLFGDEYVPKYDKTTNQLISWRPQGAACLNLRPIKTTGKRSRTWAEVVARRAQREFTPSTDKEVLGILGHENDIVAKLRDIKFIKQVLQSVLRKPMQREDGLGYDTDDDGNFKYDAGLLGAMHEDNRVHTHISQTKETGRSSSRRPPIQNLSSRREGDYRRILGELHRKPIRSVLTVPREPYRIFPNGVRLELPHGYVGMETDITGAELAVLAWSAQDPNMVDHVRRNNLPEDHPDHYGMHAQRACQTFGLHDVTPTKSGMKRAGLNGLYVAAKNVNFGVPYGRQAEAIARQCAEEGNPVEIGQAQALIDGYFEAYPRTGEFLAECRARSQNPGWLVGPYGRYRRFFKSHDRKVIGEQERQAQNFPIQNGVADAIWLGLRNLYDYRARFDPRELWFDIMLQIHDSVVLLVPAQFAVRVYEEVLPTCLVDQLPFFPRYLDGREMEHVTEPYRFGLDRSVFVHWGESLTAEEATERELPEWMAA